MRRCRDRNGSGADDARDGTDRCSDDAPTMLDAVSVVRQEPAATRATVSAAHVERGGTAAERYGLHPYYDSLVWPSPQLPRRRTAMAVRREGRQGRHEHTLQRRIRSDAFAARNSGSVTFRGWQEDPATDPTLRAAHVERRDRRHMAGRALNVMGSAHHAHTTRRSAGLYAPVELRLPRCGQGGCSSRSRASRGGTAASGDDRRCVTRECGAIAARTEE